MATARALARVLAAGASVLVLVAVAAYARSRLDDPLRVGDTVAAALLASAAWLTLEGLLHRRPSLPLAGVGLVGAAWAAHAADALWASGRLLPNHLASELQLGAACVLLASALAAGAWGLGGAGRPLRAAVAGFAVALGAGVAASAWLGLPWTGVAPAPGLAALFAGLALLAAWSLRVGIRRPAAALAVGTLAAGWLVHAARLVADVQAGASVAVLSYAAPAAIALAPVAAAFLLGARASPTPRTG